MYRRSYLIWSPVIVACTQYSCAVTECSPKGSKALNDPLRVGVGANLTIRSGDCSSCRRVISDWGMTRYLVQVGVRVTINARSYRAWAQRDSTGTFSGWSCYGSIIDGSMVDITQAMVALVVISK